MSHPAMIDELMDSSGHAPWHFDSISESERERERNGRLTAVMRAYVHASAKEVECL